MAEKPEVNKSEAIRDHFKLNPKAKSQEVVDALGKKGITVTAGLVRIVKSKHNKRQAAKKATKTAATSEAKTNGVNKTQAVRDYLKANKKAKNAEVVAALGKKGITITIGYVRTIKAKKKTRRRAVRTVVAKGGVGIAEVKLALAFLKATGSITAAKKALEVAQEIRAIV